jgi:N-(5-amino-5-carboxypentanoyl)-L-cysteinyl-D-valine synthase
MPSFEALARYYLAHVRRLQPSGPYSLLGWSFGGVLALEMALQLAREGETVANLFFIDSFFNVKKACVELGLPETRAILDPIHHRYMPSERDLARLRAGAANLVLFKATHGNEGLEENDRRRLFDYYARSRSNNLDTLLAPASFTVEPLGDGTHFSWVRDEALVGAIGARIRALVHRQPQA